MKLSTQKRIDSLMLEHEIALQEHRHGSFEQRVAARKAMRDAITLALKEQDRDTRHACAEAVLTCRSSDGARELFGASRIIEEDYMLQSAHQVCMNVQAI